jgi:hypothetical protein
MPDVLIVGTVVEHHHQHGDVMGRRGPQGAWCIEQVTVVLMLTQTLPVPLNASATPSATPMPVPVPPPPAMHREASVISIQPALPAAQRTSGQDQSPPLIASQTSAANRAVAVGFVPTSVLGGLLEALMTLLWIFAARADLAAARFCTAPVIPSWHLRVSSRRTCVASPRMATSAVEPASCWAGF